MDRFGKKSDRETAVGLKGAIEGSFIFLLARSVSKRNPIIIIAFFFIDDYNEIFKFNRIIRCKAQSL